MEFRWIAIAAALLATACGSSSPTPAAVPTLDSGLTNGPVLAAMSGANVLALSVNGAQCLTANSSGYLNKPCVNVTVCDPGGGNCQTITDVLLDTGSYGLRVFKSVLSAGLASALTPIASGGEVAECVTFGDGSSDWGPVERAEVQLAGEPATAVPIQVIDSTFARASSYCPGASTDPVSAGYNAILGVGLFAQDCGEGCVEDARNQLYFGCTSGASTATCAGIALGLGSQVTNPVALLPQDNNGVLIELPSLAPGGAPSVDGYVVLGIGTEPNNQPSGVTAFAADPDFGEFTTNFGGATYVSSFLDTGSAGIYFDPPESVSAELPDCGGQDAGWFCPSSTQTFSAANVGSGGSPIGNLGFYSGNYLALTSGGANNVFVEATAAVGSSGTFDWGLPFFLGRSVYVGLERASSSLGAGTYWAY